ncbi:hypothetical protein T492DRAFT_1090146 [Pavlovales sp. CCMP2436]|nr:hypothetical protein T492DRAFT_1090146 [Pavlovales sp. CCMP2436]
MAPGFMTARLALALCVLCSAGSFAVQPGVGRRASRVHRAARISLGEPGDEAEKPAQNKLAAAIGLSGLAGGATVAGTATTGLVTAAGGVCAGGACVAGAGALAGGGGGAAAAAATGGGIIASIKAMLVGGALVAGGAFSTAMGAPTLESMVAVSTPLNVAVASGRPIVMEFYGNACPHCRKAAKSLRAVEESAIHDKGVSWVMVNIDDPRMAPVWQMYRVDEIPHFEFFNAKGDEVGFEVGDVESSRVEARIAEAMAAPASK